MAIGSSICFIKSNPFSLIINYKSVRKELKGMVKILKIKFLRIDLIAV